MEHLSEGKVDLVKKNILLYALLDGEQTENICMAAVKQDGRALRFVKKRTPELCMAADA